MSQRQLAMVINLDKCIGCQTCTVACSTHRLNHPGTEMLRYIWCETKPGEGWPKGWMELGRKVADPVRDYGGTWSFNWEEVYTSPVGAKYLHPVTKETGEPVKWGPIWEEDQGAGEWPNGYFFYMPRLCNHCTDAPCIAVCQDHFARGGGMPSSQGNGHKNSLRKRDEDGIVVIDPSSCDECGLCAAACPYKIPMENLVAGTYEMCDFCAGRVENQYAPVCAKSCPARGMYFGYLDDKDSFVAKLVNEYKVASAAASRLQHRSRMFTTYRRSSGQPLSQPAISRPVRPIFRPTCFVSTSDPALIRRWLRSRSIARAPSAANNPN